MAQPELKLVPRQNEEQRSTSPARREGVLHPWYQELLNFSRQFAVLVFIVIGMVVWNGVQYVSNQIQGPKTPTPTPGASEYVATNKLYVFSKPGLIAKNRVGACDLGTRARVIGTATVDGDVWYEIEILSKHPANIDSLKQKWVLGKRLVLARS